MSVVTLAFTASQEEWVSGVPKSIIIESNVPSTIYYTTDGTTPTLASLIYIDPVHVPTSLSSFTLNAFGVDGDGYYSSILTQVFEADTTKISSGRYANGEGIVVDSYANETNTPFGYDASGAVGTVIDLTEEYVYRNTIHTAHGAPGDKLGTLVDVIIPDPTDTPSHLDDQMTQITSTRYAHTFDPFAKVINIDNRLPNEVNMTMRPWGSFENVSRENGGVRLRGGSEATYVTGGFVRRFYDRANGTMTSYYWDSNESRWIRNIQEMPKNIPQTAGVYSAVENPYVFRWISRGRQTSNMV
jgi:hypothetical protein